LGYTFQRNSKTADKQQANNGKKLHERKLRDVRDYNRYLENKNDTTYWYHLVSSFKNRTADSTGSLHNC
jgi:hypothetical protein